MAFPVQPVLAKHVPPSGVVPEAATLYGHTRAVLSAVELFLDCHAPQHLSDSFAFNTDQTEKCARILRVAAILHDSGKANDHFQRLMRGDSLLQAIRHEQISYWIARTFLEYLPDLSVKDRHMVAWAVLGHHRQYPDDTNREGCGMEVAILKVGTFDALAKLLGLDCAPELPSSVKVIGRGSLPRFLEAQDIDSTLEAPSWSQSDRILLGVLKNSLMLADILGSAVGRNDDLAAWARTAWQNVCETGDCAAVANSRLNGKEPRLFQRQLGESRRRVTLAIAGCGSGKTIGAYLWGERHAVGRKLFVCYPTTGTATEGFRDYLQDADATLSHSRAAIDFDLLGMDDRLGEYEDSLQVKRAICEWHPKMLTCTADLVLGIVHNAHASICAWPSLVNGAFVFDEIHAYDESMWQSLLVFLRTFRSPVLLMTASLPDARRRELEKMLAEAGERIEIIPGSQQLEGLPRYRCAPAVDPTGLVRAQFAKGGKILWVANTVTRCLDVADRFTDIGVLIYHSRYRYADRLGRHRELVAEFRAEGPALAVCTQVAEMSLDLSADLLVCDLAPVPALIQRLGRLNRRSTPEEPTPPAPFLIVPPENTLPYEAADLESARKWLAAMGVGPLSQQTLSEAWTMNMAPWNGIFQNEWLDGFMQTRPGPIREGSASISVLLQADVDVARANPNRLPELVIPMTPPPGREWQSWPVVGYARVVPANRITYNPMRGAQWTR